MNRIIAASVVLFGCACSGEAARSDEPAVVPESMSVTALPGGNGVLELTALTLRQGPRGIELYAALQNVGDRPACHAALSVELFDKDQQSLAAAISGLLTQQFYRLRGDSQTIAACVGPGDVTMAALLDFGSEVALADVASVVYRSPYFALDVRHVAGLQVSDTKRVGAAVRGTLHNALDRTLGKPTVSVFATTRTGRPLGMALASREGDLAPGASWQFETGALDDTGVNQLAFPAGALEQ